MQLSDRTYEPQRPLGRVLRMGLPELMCRGRQETLKWVDRMRATATAADSKLRRDPESIDRFFVHCEKHFFEGVFDPRVPETLASANVDESQAILVAADRVSHGRFNLLGYRNLEFGDPIDWHFDPVSARRAPFVHWSRLDPLDCTTVGDSKVIWELNRHQWLVHLGQAWRLTGDERYGQTLIEYVQAWLRVNPAGMGINWASSLEVAFRLIAWCWSFLLIRNVRALTPDVFSELKESIQAHATHIERYLSTYFSPNTHLTGEALGLFYAGVLFPDFKRAERWRSIAIRILEQEIERQVLPDGVYFEESTCYQRYTVDIYLHFLILAARSGVGVVPAVTQRVKSMVDVLVALRQPDGSMPNIGDADGGMVLPLNMSEPHDFRGTFSTAAVLFNDPVYAWAAGSLAPETLWLLGTRAIETFEALEKSPPTVEASRLFSSGGFAVMRDGWNRDANSLIFDAGPRRALSAHGHADSLSVQCSAFGEQYLIDAGTGCYTADAEVRNFFRGSAAHSTVVVDAMGQAQPAAPFSWSDRPSAHLHAWLSTDSFDFADASHDGYAKLPDPVSHRRRVIFVKPHYWILVDDLSGTATHTVEVRFQFAPMDVRIDESGFARATRDGRRGLFVRAVASVPVEARLREGCRSPMEGWISRDYGQLEPAPLLAYEATTRLPLRVVTLLFPSQSIGETVPSVEVIRNREGHPARLVFADRGESIHFDDGKPSIDRTSAPGDRSSLRGMSCAAS